jgi:hypothetical protein
MSENERSFANFVRNIRASAPISSVQLERALHRIGSLVQARAVVNSPIDTGNLRNHIFYEVNMGSHGGEVVVGVKGVPYAAAQEFGGTLVSRGKMFTIPITPWAKTLRRNMRSLRGAGLVRAGRVLFDPRKVTKADRKAGRIPDRAIGFILSRKINMPARYYMRDAIRHSAPTIIEILRGLGNGQQTE